MSPEGIDPQEIVYGDNYRPKRKKDHPSPQPSGRTAKGIIAGTTQEIGLINNAYAIGDIELNILFRDIENELQACECQLFDAMVEIVGTGIFIDPNKTRGELIGELRSVQIEKLRVFFNQPKESGKEIHE